MGNWRISWGCWEEERLEGVLKYLLFVQNGILESGERLHRNQLWCRTQMLTASNLEHQRQNQS